MTYFTLQTHCVRFAGARLSVCQYGRMIPLQRFQHQWLYNRSIELFLCHIGPHYFVKRKASIIDVKLNAERFNVFFPVFLKNINIYTHIISIFPDVKHIVGGFCRAFAQNNLQRRYDVIEVGVYRFIHSTAQIKIYRENVTLFNRNKMPLYP